jgi:hypothetical protein
MRRFICRSLATLAVALTVGAVTGTPPPTNPRRLAGSFDWCDCGTGTANLTVWTDEPRVSRRPTVLPPDARCASLSARSTGLPRLALCLDHLLPIGPGGDRR